MNPHVFVVMPYGKKDAVPAVPAAEGTPVSEPVIVDFDRVYWELIKPALEKSGCLPFRADEEGGAGDIRTDMYFELVTADLVVADISIPNANVFYELGIRHGITPRGVFTIHGGLTKRPFDIAPDRSFGYEGALFRTDAPRDGANRTGVQGEVARLSVILRAAIDSDRQTIGSPVYKELQGLKPVDWSGITSARARYFGDVFADWKARIEVARQNGFPGDILTLADDAPTRFHRTQLLWAAAKALTELSRFEATKSVLDDLLELDSDHMNALTQYGLVLGRLGRFNEARVHMTRVADAVSEGAGVDPEVQGILGRSFKDLWRQQWREIPNDEERKRRAMAASDSLCSAISSYDVALRVKLDYYNGINVLSLSKILEHLKRATGDDVVEMPVKDLDDVASVVRFSAKNVPRKSDIPWVKATLAELELVSGDPHRALALYEKIAYSLDATPFQVASMLEQILLFQALGFQPEAVSPIRELLEQRAGELGVNAPGGPSNAHRFRKLVVFSGHMTDLPNRAKERFPERKTDSVREKLAVHLDEWEIGAGDLAICGGARGGDILFAELCADRGADVWLHLALPEPEFLEASVRVPGTDWVDRYFTLSRRVNVKTFSQFDRLKEPPKGASVFERNNRWVLNTARAEADNPRNIHALLVWDQQPAGDGPGGTSHFAARIDQLGGRVAEPINPLNMP